MKEMKKDSSGRRFRKRKVLLWFLIILLVLFVLLPLLLHWSPVQNWLVGKTTRNLSSKTNAAVTIESVDFSIFKGLILDDLYISHPDQPTDTLCHIGSLSTSLRENLLSIVRKELLLNVVNVEDAKFNLTTYGDSEHSTLEEFLKRLTKVNKESDSASGENLRISLSTCLLYTSPSPRDATLSRMPSSA